MISKNWRVWNKPNLVWSMAVMGSAGAGLFLGMGQSAHSDISKFSALLTQNERVPGELIVKLSKQGKLALRMNSAAALFDASSFGVTAADAFETNDSFYLVKLADGKAANFMEAAQNNPNFEYAEPNYIMHALGYKDHAPDVADVIPNDADFNKLWGMKNTGQKDAAGTTGTAGADIGATKAWNITTGNKNILVGIIDTGVDYNHPDLKDNMWTNPGEIADNGIDDDGNGFVDDIHGWNFSGGGSTNDPMDDNEHGTHVAGTIGGKGNDGQGVAGVNWNASIVGIKFLTGTGSGSLADAVKSIQYATKIGAKMTNNSWGGGSFTQSMFDAIKEAEAAGSLFIAAAGNDSQNADNTPHYPAGYQANNVIAVAATTNQDTLATFSTYGKRSVHIAAPGHKIYSSVPGGKYDTFSGTSMATPHVTGAAALVWGTMENASYAEVKDRLLRSRDYVGSLSRKVANSGRLNVYNALTETYPVSPEPSEADWQDFALTAPIESAHPYASNAKQEFVVQGPANAKFIRVVFSKVDLEDSYDFVKVVDAQGNELDSISGRADNLASFYGAGSSLKLRFTSDSTQNKWGFAVGKVQVVY
ncbi:MAG: subtilase [Proteobacteria bacterium]|nr:MAG: subtilase [Pseudomonadota bacterium]